MDWLDSIGKWFQRITTPPKSDEHYKKAYEKKKPFSEWYNWIVGPTGYESGVNWWAANPGGTLMEDWFEGDITGGLTAENLRKRIDWRKAVSGGKTGFNYGGTISPGYGHLIGTGVGAGVGSVFTGGPEYDTGIAAAAEGRAKDPYWSEWNEPFKWVNTAMDLYGTGRSMQGGSYGSGPRQIGRAGRIFGPRYGGNIYDVGWLKNLALLSKIMK